MTCLAHHGCTITAMKMRKKSELPSKICVHCSLYFREEFEITAEDGQL